MNIPGRRIEENEIITTEPFPRGGDGMFLRAQMIDRLDSTGNLEVAVFTRNTEEDWPGLATATMNMTLTNGAVSEIQVEGLKEQIRVRVTGPTGTGTAAVVRIFPPLFYDAAIGNLP